MNFKPIKIENDTEITITLYSSLDAGSFTDEKTVKWSEWLKTLSVPRVNEYKYKRGLAIYGKVADSDGKPHYRTNNNIINRSIIALDYDDISKDVDLIEILKHKLGKAAYCLYSTHSHTPENKRYRVLIPLDEPLDPKYYKGVVEVLERHIGVKLDDKSRTVSQAMALPVIKHKDSEYIFEYNDGEVMKRDYFISKLKVLNKDKQQGKIKISRNDKYDDIAMGAGEGGRNNAVTSIIGLLLQRRVPDKLVYGLAYGYNQMCEPPLPQKEFDRTFISIYRTHYGKGGIE